MTRVKAKKGKVYIYSRLLKMEETIIYSVNIDFGFLIGIGIWL